MPEPETVTETTTRHLVLDAKLPYRIAAGIIAPGALVGVALAVTSDEKPVLWRLAIGALSLLGGYVFGLVALRKRARIWMGTTTVKRPVEH